ncbi:hypothetical protein D3C80_1220130 [compost metagenome]
MVVDDVVEDALVERVGVVGGIGREGRQARSRRDGRDADRRAGVLIDLIMAPAQNRLGPRRDVPAQGRAGRPVVLAIIILACGGVGQPAIATVRQGVDPQGHGVVDRDVDQTFEAAFVIFAEPDAQARLELVAGLVGRDGDGARGAVAAEQGALRPFQHLDARHIAESQQGRARPGRIDAVDIDADRRVGADAEVRGRDAADAIAGLGRAGVRDRQAGHEGGHVAHVVGGQRLQGRGGEHADRDRHLLETLFAALRGDDDVVQRRRLLRPGQIRPHQSDCAHACSQRRLQAEFHLDHSRPPKSPFPQLYETEYYSV